MLARVELVYRREVDQMTRDGIEALQYFSESSETDVSDTIRVFATNGNFRVLSEL